MRINYNVSAMITNNNLANNDSALAKSLERLSSGLKINSAKDNPAGLAMAKRMNAQLEGLSKANQNASDGVSIIETADGAMSEISEMLQRMNELTMKAANGVESDKDREIIQEEVKQLTQEIDRVAEATEFNGQRLLNGEFSYKGYVESSNTNHLKIKVASYSSDVAVKPYKINGLEIDKDALTGEYKVGVSAAAPGTLTTVEAVLEDGGFPKGATASIKDDLLTIKAPNGFEMTLDLTRCDLGNNNLPFALNNLTINAEGLGAMRLQIGANEGQVLEINIPKISLREMGLETIKVTDKNGQEVWTLDVSTEEAATEAIDRVAGAIQFISGVRGQLGAYQNRLESTINSLDITSENMTAAYSRIMDVDMAEEMTNYTTYQVMTQAATSMLAQANERPSQVLQLLQ
ncbi:MAG: flagellin FliC3 [Lachnospiraceae bacterium]|uniref:flagellin N-terminal helical domain-containing protein n=1 Tax=uncultured Acetatifactor sp. TaxID=1671927 RepID=UPI00262861C4|nr:flagellin [uncultured Acetatifactor sp.]MCI8787755.1 flagellin FliC3 [Lachnospiraceae bacterium]